MEVKAELEDWALEQQILNPIVDFDESNSIGYLATVKFATVIGEDNSGSPVTHSLVIKTGLANSQLRDRFMVPTLVGREMFLYKTVFPALCEFENKYGVSTISQIIPQSYAILEKKEAIIMENLRANGFENYHQHLEMDDEHVKVVFSTYAQFHATSFALRIQDPDTFYSLTKDLNNTVVSLFKKGGFYPVISYLLQTLEVELDLNTDSNILKKYVGFWNNFEKIFDEMENDSNPLLLLHGDSWFNNMLIKYVNVENLKQPTSLRLIDFQFGFVGQSPAYDLVWFFYICTTNEVMENLLLYQEYYHAEFSKRLRDLGVDPDTNYPFKQFQEEWKKFAPYGLILASLFRYVMLLEESERVNFNEVMESGVELKDLPVYKNMINIKKYYERMKNVIIHFVSNDFI